MIVFYWVPQIHSEHLCGATSRSTCHQHHLPTTSPYQQDVQSDPSIGLFESRWPLQDVGPPRRGSGCVMVVSGSGLLPWSGECGGVLQ